jgi:probable rRNA maturation factor
MTPAIDVQISDTQTRLPVDRAALAALVKRVLHSERRTRAEISIALVDNATIHVLNRMHLDHDWPTDVITFPLSEPNDPVLSGELVVSAEMARDVATESDHDPAIELALYVAHGLLHLCGYDHQTEPDTRLMRAREEDILAHTAGIAASPIRD